MMTTMKGSIITLYCEIFDKSDIYNEKPRTYMSAKYETGK